MFRLIYRKYGNRFYAKDDVLSGVTVALALIPEAVAFAFVAGVAPLVGLYAAFIVGLITAVFGGRPAMISGATGALAVVIVSLVSGHGVQYLFPTVVLMGVIQIGVGLLKLGKFIRLVPHPVMLGFVNGLAIVIFLAQLPQFSTDPTTPGAPWMPIPQLSLMLGLVLLTMTISHFLPKFTTKVPSSLVAILAVTGVTIALAKFMPGAPMMRTVADLADIKGGFPIFQWFTVPLNMETLSIIWKYAAIMAAVGLIESLMTLQLIDELTETRGDGNRECVGQGAANVVTGFFGGMGGCAMIGQSMINIRAGGRKRLSGISASLFLLISILFASKYIGMIPLAALTGVMMMVVLGTFEWASIRTLRKVPVEDAFVIILVTVVTVFTDLALAVVSGVIVSALVYAWKSAKEIRIEETINDHGTKMYLLRGPLFFGSIRNFQEKFHPRQDPDDVIIDFAESRVCDHSGIEAINSLAERYLKAGTTLHLRHLSPECVALLTRAGDLVEVNIMEDPHYHVAVDKELAHAL